MAKYLKLMLHCAASIEGVDVRPEQINRMHMGCLINKDGSVLYKGKKYASLDALPKNDYIDGVPARETRGRGWSRGGYSKYYTLDGKAHVLRAYNEDNWIDSNEFTNGALGTNGHTRHFCYGGGLSKRKRNGKHFALLTMTEEQEQSMLRDIKAEIAAHPHIVVGGHNQYANKGCPSMITALWLEVHGIPKKNIDQTKLKTTLQPVFDTPAGGNAFRAWVNDHHPDFAKSINLDRTGHNNNEYILRAWYKLRHDYKRYNENSPAA
jgi:hypothetical protein